MNSPSILIKREYDKVWCELWQRENHEDIIEARKTDRKMYYDTILKYSNCFNKPRIVEVGCGSGIDINLIKRQNKRIQSYALDLSAKSIKLGRKITEEFGDRIDYLVADTLNLSFKDAQFDVIYSQGLIEHFENPINPIMEQLRVLRDGGYVIINVPQKFTGYTFMKKKKIKSGDWHLGWEIEFSYWDLKKIGSLLNLTPREVFGYQYWRSWQEPAFVLRDFYDKLSRRNPFKNIGFFQNIKILYDSFWFWLERNYGHFFLKNIVIVFQKEHK